MGGLEPRRRIRGEFQEYGIREELVFGVLSDVPVPEGPYEISSMCRLEADDVGGDTDP